MKEIVLYGAGGHCKVVMDILEINGIKISVIVDDNPKNDSFMGIKCSLPQEKYTYAIITIGNCQVRKRIVESIKVEEYLTVIHPFSFVSKNSTIGKGTVVMSGTIIQSGVSIGAHCIINTKSSVDHDCIIEDYVHIASGATLCGGVTIGECAWIGAGSVIKQGVRIGKNCMIGTGAVVLKDIPDNVIAYGNPCRIVKTNEII